MTYQLKSHSKDAIVYAEVDEDGSETGNYIYEIQHLNQQINVTLTAEGEPDLYEAEPLPPVEEPIPLHAELTPEQERATTNYRALLATIGASSLFLILIVISVLFGVIH